MKKNKVEIKETSLDKEDIELLSSQIVFGKAIIAFVVILGGYLSYLAYTKDAAWYLITILVIFIVVGLFVGYTLVTSTQKDIKDGRKTITVGVISDVWEEFSVSFKTKPEKAWGTRKVYYQLGDEAIKYFGALDDYHFTGYVARNNTNDAKHRTGQKIALHRTTSGDEIRVEILEDIAIPEIQKNGEEVIVYVAFKAKSTMPFYRYYPRKISLNNMESGEYFYFQVLDVLYRVDENTYNTYSSMTPVKVESSSEGAIVSIQNDQGNWVNLNPVSKLSESEADKIDPKQTQPRTS